MEEFTKILPTEGGAHQGLGRIDLTITEVGHLVEEDLAVAEAAKVAKVHRVVTLAITMAVSPTLMIKGRLKAIWASTIITTLARKTPSTRTAVVIMVVECPPLSSIPKPSQMVMPRVMVIMKVRLKLRLKMSQYRQNFGGAASHGMQIIATKKIDRLILPTAKPLMEASQTLRRTRELKLFFSESSEVGRKTADDGI